MKCGLGVRPELFESFFTRRPQTGFVEAHSENYFGESLARAKLLQLREDYAVSLHGVGLSLGRADALNNQHLTELKQLVDEIEPLFVSEHLAWSAYAHQHLPDLLPLPLNQTSLALMCQHIDQMQSALGRAVLIENPSNYLLFDELQVPEPEFLNQLAEQTGCGLLLDINNIYVSAINLERDPRAFLNAINSEHVQQYHLAGHTPVSRSVHGERETLLIDTHNQPVAAAVWELFDHALSKHGRRPTLLEWDSDFPEFEVLLQQCEIADKLMLDRVESVAPLVVKQTTLRNDSEQLGHMQREFLTSVLEGETNLSQAKPRLSHRIAVYQNNVFAACQDYLAEVYAASAGVLGAQYFKQLAQGFIQAHAPSTGNIALYGEHLIDHTRSVEALESLPYLADLMTFEWALHRAYFAKATSALEPTHFSEEALLSLPIKPNSSVTLISSAYPIAEIHRQSLPDFVGEVSIDLAQSQDQILVFKHRHRVTHEVVEPSFACLLDAIENNGNLLQAIDQVSGSIQAQQLSADLNQILTKGLLQAVD